MSYRVRKVAVGVLLGEHHSGHQTPSVALSAVACCVKLAAGFGCCMG